MAISNVEGKVTRVFFDGKGAEVTEVFTVRGKEMSKRWTAWFEQPHGLDVGAAVKVSGLHGDELNEWPDKETGEVKRSVKRSLNKARVEGASPAYDSSIPF